MINKFEIARCPRLALSVAIGSLAAGMALGDTAFVSGEWGVRFVAEGSTLTLSHSASGVELEGSLKFKGPGKATDSDAAPDADWRLADSRDGARNRLALVDLRNDAQGYITFQPNGSRLGMLVYHRTALAYRGRLTFSGEIRCRADAFAANTFPQPGERVLQLFSGEGESPLHNTLFSPGCDEAFQICAPGGLRLKNVSSGRWAFEISLDIADAAKAAVQFSVERDYYRSRWVPNYAPIDRTRCPRAPTGWMSWNSYFDRAGSEDNLAEARLGAKLLKPFGLEIWSIESWQGNSDSLPVSKFHNMNLETNAAQFPEGMKWLSGEIRKLGFRPGIWIAPFGTGNTNFYKAHTDWFLHGKDNKPLSCWNGAFTLDPTVKAARDHLRDVFRTASRDWGYEFFKIDGMSGRNSGYCAHMYERPEVRECFADPACPNPFELCVKAFREGIGDDRIFLACQGHFTGAEAAYADASRTGADIVAPNQPVRWANILLQARCTVNQIFTHNIVFWADPDCMMVSEDALQVEEARVEATVVALPGQQMFSGDKLAALAPDRIRLLQQALPVADVRPGNLYPQFGRLPVWNLSVKRPFGDWHVVALFNWDDREKSVGFDWREIGEEPSRRFLGWEFWTGSFLGPVNHRLDLAVPPHGVRLVALQHETGHPQFLSSDRHITQGAVGLNDQQWADGTLALSVEAVGGFPQTVRVAVPEGFSLKSASAPGAAISIGHESGGRVLAVSLEAEKSGAVPLALSFEKE